ncbi:unnamed protein product [Ceratitis capitata]|uniref:(Mediterranean fruit fly) hypothetical protein n=1 Tax=Ceratitis capitata TaxID=7213 RepID=A0A811URK4_CERCA|nr:unnamed protein product [Ceratitis capitata]
MVYEQKLLTLCEKNVSLRNKLDNTISEPTQNVAHNIENKNSNEIEVLQRIPSFKGTAYEGEKDSQNLPCNTHNRESLTEVMRQEILSSSSVKPSLQTSKQYINQNKE